MGCPSQVTLENNLVFSICTHDPMTGALTDADALPAYRVYEAQTATPLLTGTLAKLDDANTTGFYSEQIACTAANGFEADKSYTVYIEATVNGDTGGISYGFTVAASLLATLLEGRSLEEILKDMWAQVVGNFSADDAETPTEIIYQGPDGTTQFAHTLTDTTREWSE